MSQDLKLPYKNLNQIVDGLQGIESSLTEMSKEGDIFDIEPVLNEVGRIAMSIQMIRG